MGADKVLVLWPEASEDEGFTLIELMTTVLIVAILMAVAIPTFLGARGNALDAAARSSVDLAYETALVHLANDQTLDGLGPLELAALEPSLDFLGADTGSNGPLEVSVWGSRTRFRAAARSESGICVVLDDDGRGELVVELVELTPCQAAP